MQQEVWKEVQLAEVEFQHGRGCAIGTPYGECTKDCGWKVVRLDIKTMRPRYNLDVSETKRI